MLIVDILFFIFAAETLDVTEFFLLTVVLVTASENIMLVVIVDTELCFPNITDFDIVFDIDAPIPEVLFCKILL